MIAVVPSWVERVYFPTIVIVIHIEIICAEIAASNLFSNGSNKDDLITEKIEHQTDYTSTTFSEQSGSLDANSSPGVWVTRFERTDTGKRSVIVLVFRSSRPIKSLASGEKGF